MNPNPTTQLQFENERIEEAVRKVLGIVPVSSREISEREAKQSFAKQLRFETRVNILKKRDRRLQKQRS